MGLSVVNGCDDSGAGIRDHLINSPDVCTGRLTEDTVRLLSSPGRSTITICLLDDDWFDVIVPSATDLRVEIP